MLDSLDNGTQDDDRSFEDLLDELLGC